MSFRNDFLLVLRPSFHRPITPSNVLHLNVHFHVRDCNSDHSTLDGVRGIWSANVVPIFFGAIIFLRIVLATICRSFRDLQDVRTFATLQTQTIRKH